MCRSIKTLRKRDETASDDEVQAAALQFVRKISGYRQPSAKNTEAFEAAVADITGVSRRLLDALTSPAVGGEAGRSARKGPRPQAATPSTTRPPRARGR